LVAYGLVTTLADEVSLAESRAELLAVLGDIDTLDEAVLWAKIDGNGISCSSTVRQDGNDYEFRFQQLVSDCPISYSMNVLRVGRDGALETTSSTPIEDGRDICVGRRPAGHLDGGHMHTGHLVGDFFADVAQLERAAVTAFASLAEELAHFGAPLQLQERALQAREDEIRHANLTAQLARRHGGIPLSPAHVRPALKSLFTFALENMKEGCVRETHGAAVAEFQARRSTDRRFVASSAPLPQRNAVTQSSRGPSTRGSAPSSTSRSSHNWTSRGATRSRNCGANSATRCPNRYKRSLGCPTTGRPWPWSIASTRSCGLPESRTLFVHPTRRLAASGRQARPIGAEGPHAPPRTVRKKCLFCRGRQAWVQSWRPVR
jgi:hypothetical protein